MVESTARVATSRTTSSIPCNPAATMHVEDDLLARNFAQAAEAGRCEADHLSWRDSAKPVTDSASTSLRAVQVEASLCSPPPFRSRRFGQAMIIGSGLRILRDPPLSGRAAAGDGDPEVGLHRIPAHFDHRCPLLSGGMPHDAPKATGQASSTSVDRAYMTYRELMKVMARALGLRKQVRDSGPVPDSPPQLVLDPLRDSR